MSKKKRHIIPVYKASSFFTTDPNVKIYDRRYNLFYAHKNSAGALTFNLPKGYYFTDNNIEALNEFQPYPELILPEGHAMPHKDVEMFIGNNPNKASIWPEAAKILVDNKIANHPYEPAAAFVLGHELWHTVYPGSGPKPKNFDESNKMEKNCDRGSCNSMMKIGYNPVQVMTAAHILLGRTSPERASNLKQLIEELKTRR